jgi:hypothetical protein
MVTADEARQIRSDRGNVNHETYKDINTKINNRIKLAASRGETNTQYRIPHLVPGRPLYEISHAIRYNRDKLLRAGFRVDVVEDTLRVDWKPIPPKPKKENPKKEPPETPTAPTLSSISDKLAAIGKKMKKIA